MNIILTCLLAAVLPQPVVSTSTPDVKKIESSVCCPQCGAQMQRGTQIQLQIQRRTRMHRNILGRSHYGQQHRYMRGLHSKSMNRGHSGKQMRGQTRGQMRGKSMRSDSMGGHRGKSMGRGHANNNQSQLVFSQSY